ncbi:hypothetical protein EIP91_005518 [Steccherinum ochraceum]|uniref:Btz domain-containing protein n=1 Tax=Steccherinum ochraceum TaxID=92696 RepID=A0A4R0RWR8_9APHY|nr:hypothetical protein EIP91_005518 [Steccherinum ochraceum]
MSSIVTRDPRQQHSSPPTSTTPPATVTPPQQAVSPPQPPIITAPNVQSTLMALLSQAANAVATSNGQTAPNSAPAPSPSLDANQLALFQQLTQTAKAAGNVPTQPVHLPVSLVPSATANAVPPVAPPLGGPSQPLPYRDDHVGSGRRDPKYDRYDGFDRGSRNRDDVYDDRRAFRGGDFRGGPNRGGFRGRGRGRWEDRERFPPRNNREKDWDASRSRRSRSRSPPRRQGGGAGGRGYNDNAKPITTYMSDIPSNSPPRIPKAAPQDSDKDEFGRDIRPQSSTPPPASVHDTVQATQSPPEERTAPVPPPEYYVPGAIPEKLVEPVESHLQTHSGPSPVTATPSTSSPSLVTPSSSSGGGGLDSVDMSTFNPTDPSSWETLGKAWTETHGSMPSQEELMQFVMGGMAVTGGGAMTGGYSDSAQNQYGMQQQQQPESQGTWSGQQQNQPWGHSGRGRGRGRGRGGHGYGNGRGRGGGQWGYSGGRDRYESTDAIMLGGGDEDWSMQDHSNGDNGNGGGWQGQSSEYQNYQVGVSSGHNDQGPDQAFDQDAPSGGSRAGKMQRVGDKWVFVRADAAAAPHAAEVA